LTSFDLTCQLAIDSLSLSLSLLFFIVCITPFHSLIESFTLLFYLLGFSRKRKEKKRKQEEEKREKKKFPSHWECCCSRGGDAGRRTTDFFTKRVFAQRSRLFDLRVTHIDHTVSV